MLPSALLAFTATLLAPLVAASSNPTCVPNVNGYDIPTATDYYNDFCTKLQDMNFTNDVRMYGLPYMTFTFAPQPGNGTCNLGNCIQSFGSIFNNCKYNNWTIYGTAQLNAGCGTYNYTIGNQTSSLPPSTGSQTNTSAIVPSPTGTPGGKSNAGTTTLGSGADLVKVSGSLMLGVASIFVIFL